MSPLLHEKTCIYFGNFFTRLSAEVRDLNSYLSRYQRSVSINALFTRRELTCIHVRTPLRAENHISRLLTAYTTFLVFFSICMWFEPLICFKIKLRTFLSRRVGLIYDWDWRTSTVSDNRQHVTCRGWVSVCTVVKSQSVWVITLSESINCSP